MCDYSRIIKGGVSPLIKKVKKNQPRRARANAPLKNMNIKTFAFEVEKDDAIFRELKIYRVLQREIIWNNAQNIKLELIKSNNSVIGCNFIDLKHNCALEEHARNKDASALKVLKNLLWFANIDFNLSSRTFKRCDLSKVLYGLNMFCKSKFGVQPPLYKLEFLIKSF